MGKGTDKFLNRLPRTDFLSQQGDRQQTSGKELLMRSTQIFPQGIIMRRLFLLYFNL